MPTTSETRRAPARALCCPRRGVIGSAAGFGAGVGTRRRVIAHLAQHPPLTDHAASPPSLRRAPPATRSSPAPTRWASTSRPTRSRATGRTLVPSRPSTTQTSPSPSPARRTSGELRASAAVARVAAQSPLFVAASRAIWRCRAPCCLAAGSRRCVLQPALSLHPSPSHDAPPPLPPPASTTRTRPSTP